MMKKELLQKAINKQEQSLEDTNSVPPTPLAPKLMPQDFIINPLLSIHTMVDDLALEVDDLRKATQKNEQILASILDRESGILKELQDRRPKGKVTRVNQNAPDVPNPPQFPSAFFIINARRILGEDGMKWRSYAVFNPGPNNLYVGYNVGLSPEVDVSPEDLAKDDKFDFLTPNQSTGDSFDTEEIYSLHIRADPATGLGPSPFRAKLIL